MKRNKKLFQLYASTLSTENGQLTTGSPASPTRSEVSSSNDSNTVSAQRQTACVSPPTISTTSTSTSITHNQPQTNSPRSPHINPTNSPLSNNLSHTNIANLLMPYAPTTIKTTNTASFYPRPTHLSKLSPPSPLVGNKCTKLVYSNIVANFPNCPSSPTTVTTTTTVEHSPSRTYSNVHFPEKEDLYSKLWDQIDSFTLQTNNSKIHKQHKMSKPHQQLISTRSSSTTRRMKISISELLC